MRSPALAAALLLAAGCMDFRQVTLPEPPPPPEVPASFHASVSFQDQVPSEPGGGSGRAGAARGVRINATLDPGFDASGHRRQVRDDTLRIASTRLAPTQREPGGLRVYEGWVPLPEAGASGVVLRIVPPVVPGAAPATVLYQPIPVRIGGDTLRVADGAEVDLRMAVPEAPPGPRPLEQGWNLDVGAGPSRLVVSGQGPVPVPLVVPTALVPASAGEWLSARLLMHSRLGLGPQEGRYFIEIQFTAILGWTIHRSPGASR